MDSPFKNCGLNDISELYNLVIKNVDRPFDFELQELDFPDKNKSISILKISPSVNKPHVIKYYLSKRRKEIINFIPIRKSAGIFPSNRGDLDFMYYDRKNIEPEYALEINAYKPHIAFNSFTSKPLEATLQLCFQNYGTRPIAITNSHLIIDTIPEYEIHKKLIFELSKYYDPVLDKIESNIRNRYLVIPSNQIKMLHVTYNLNFNQGEEEKKNLNHKLRTPDKFIFQVSCEDINGNAYSSPDITYEK